MSPTINITENLKDMHWRWCEFHNVNEFTVTTQDDTEYVELHFNVTGSSVTRGDGVEFEFQPQQHSIFYSNRFVGRHCVRPHKKKQSFFEVRISASRFRQMLSGEYCCGREFSRALESGRSTWINKILPLTVEQGWLIESLRNSPYAGSMQRLFAESRLTELLVLQTSQFERITRQASHTYFRKEDVDKIYAAKYYLDVNFRTPCTIFELAKHVGTNQKKLKTGFRQILGNSVFGYLSDIRMYHAKRLLFEEKKKVQEVADELGYKYPHHFTVAFKKKFNILPSKPI